MQGLDVQSHHLLDPKMRPLQQRHAQRLGMSLQKRALQVTNAQCLTGTRRQICTAELDSALQFMTRAHVDRPAAASPALQVCPPQRLPLPCRAPGQLRQRAQKGPSAASCPAKVATAAAAPARCRALCRSAAPCPLEYNHMSA